MKLGNSHLCYSLNVFPAEPDVGSRIVHIGEKFNFIREQLGISKDIPFALGFWADAIFVNQMADPANLALVKQLLSDHNFYIFTLNAFPYGQFHEKPVKEKVYLPDWTTEQRTDFTCLAADFLVQILPVDTPGSISTLPGGYKQVLAKSGTACAEKIAANLKRVAAYLADLHRQHGKEIVLGIEMEPDCLWENPAEFISFYQEYLAEDENSRRYLGVCYDTCHQELIDGIPGAGLKKLLDAGIKIAKLQLSSALKTDQLTAEDFAALQPFSDDVYLHQTRIFKDTSMVEKFNDIPCSGKASAGHLVSHFHLPIFCVDLPGNISPANAELLAVIEQLQNNPEICLNLEIETYTYSVLPMELTSGTIEQNITKEYKWFLEKCRIT